MNSQPQSMDNPQFIAAILGFIAFAIPIVGALWKLFSVREQLQTQILVVQHRLDMLDQRIEYLVDQQMLFLNGMREQVQHTRDRSKHAEEALDLRLSDLEGFIEKTTAFNRRRSG